MHDGSSFPGKVNPGLLEQSKLLEILIVIIHTQPKPHLDKYRVAGVHSALYKVFSPVPCPLMAVDPSVLHDFKSGTGKGILHADHPLGKTCCHGDDLKGGTRLIGIVDGQISPHLVTGILFFLVRHARGVRIRVQSERFIEIKFRYIYICVDFSILRIYEQNGDRICLLFLHNFLCCLLCIHLDIFIQADVQVISCHRFHTAFPQLIDLHSPGIRSGEYFAVYAFQNVVVPYFQPNDALVVSSCKSQYLGGQLIAGVIPFEILIHFDTCKTVFPNPVPHFFLHICLHFFNGRNLLHSFSGSLLRKSQLFLQHGDDLIRFLYLAVYDGNGAHRFIIRQDLPLCVNDPASGCLDVTLPLVELLCLFCIVIRLYHHEIDHPAHKSCKHQHTGGKYDHCLLLVVRPVFFHSRFPCSLSL